MSLEGGNLLRHGNKKIGKVWSGGHRKDIGLRRSRKHVGRWKSGKDGRKKNYEARLQEVVGRKWVYGNLGASIEKKIQRTRAEGHRDVGRQQSQKGVDRKNQNREEISSSMSSLGRWD